MSQDYGNERGTFPHNVEPQLSNREVPPMREFQKVLSETEANQLAYSVQGLNVIGKIRLIEQAVLAAIAESGMPKLVPPPLTLEQKVEKLTEAIRALTTRDKPWTTKVREVNTMVSW